jgi:hypothetical protein
MKKQGRRLLCAALAACAAGLSHGAELQLNDDRMAATADGRATLKYLVGCALPAGTTVVADVAGARYSFPGSMGLAPDWSARALTPAEQRLLSACMLARTNRFGVPVMLSMRSDAPSRPASLEADADERRAFPAHEGAFFGNLFAPDQPVYACTASTAPAWIAHLRSQLRVCTLSAQEEGVPAGYSRCRFRIVGACAGKPFVQGGIDYSAEVVHVYLPAPK